MRKNMSDTKKAREAAFNVYAANLTACFPALKDTFICPFCRRKFDRDALKHPPKVSLAHCLPGSLGGRLKALACAECDNKAGHMVDVHLKNRMETEEFFKGQSPSTRPIKLTLASRKVPAEVRIALQKDGTPRFEFHIDYRRCPPCEFNALTTELEEGTFPENAEIGIEGTISFNQAMAKMAMLRSAYLMMFRHFGYSYICDTNVEPVRQQLLRPNEKILLGFPILQVPGYPLHVNTVLLVTTPEYQSFFVPMQFVTEGKQKICMGVFMPGIGENSPAIFQRLCTLENGHVNFKYVEVPFEARRLSSPRAVLFPIKFWLHVVGEEPSRASSGD
jgi:HNH endonuclease